MTFIILGLILVSVVGYSLSPFELRIGYEPKKKKTEFQPYVIGVNQFLVPFPEWMKEFNARLDQMTSMHDPMPELPESWVYLKPLVDPDKKSGIKVGSAHVGYSTSQSYYDYFQDSLNDCNYTSSILAGRTPNQIRMDRYGIGYTKECEKCLQPTLTSTTDRYCKVCTKNMEEQKKLERQNDDSQWVLDTNYTPTFSNIQDGLGGTVGTLTFNRYVNIHTGEYMMRTDKVTPKRVTSEFLKPLSEYTHDDFYDMTKVKLVELASKYNIPLRVSMLKADIVESLLKAGRDQQFKRAIRDINERVEKTQSVPTPVFSEELDSLRW